MNYFRGMHRTSIEVSAIVGAYNLFMNAADRMAIQFDPPVLQGIMKKWCQ